MMDHFVVGFASGILWSLVVMWVTMWAMRRRQRRRWFNRGPLELP